MQAADTTMYWAKRDGRDRIAVFDPARHANDVHLFELAGRMPGALERGEFHLEYQPLVALDDGAVVGVEALARWRTADGERLGPDVFIPLAEQTGLIVPLGLHLLERACTDARSWVDSGADAGLVLSVNVAGQQLRRPDAVLRIADVLERTGWPASSLQLELTESDLMSAAGRPVQALEELSRLGVRIAIDDFGTGYSNLVYLHRLPVDVLKLAGSFVTGRGGACPGEEGPEDPGPGDVDSPVILSAMIELAHTLGLTVVAESVETGWQARRLHDLGCDIGQGWHLGSPRPAAELAALLARARQDGGGDDLRHRSSCSAAHPATTSCSRSCCLRRPWSPSSSTTRRSGPSAGTPNRSLRPCTTSTGTPAPSSSGARVRSGRPGGCSGKARHSTAAAPAVVAVRQATRAPELRPPTTSGPSWPGRTAATTASHASSRCPAGAGARRPATR